jgi:serine protease Do
LFAAALASVVPEARPDPADALQQQVVRVFAEHADAVVRVKVAAESPEAGDRPTVLIDTGFFIDRDGRVLTTLRASKRPSRIWVEKDGVESLAELLGVDARTNIALLQVRKLPDRFTAIPITNPASAVGAQSGETRARPPIGSFVIAISNPLELDVTPTLGVVAGFESFFSEAHQFPFTYLRTSVPVGRGESGSPVLDPDGRLVGIAVASVAGSRWSYLVPASVLPRMVDDLGRDGCVHYGALSAEFGEFPDAANLTRRVFVVRVPPGGSAARAGLRVGDIVKKLGPAAVHRIHDVRDALFFARPGEFIQVEIEREGRVIALALTVEAAPEPAPPILPSAGPLGEDILDTPTGH